jgi:hypothetical protein
MDYAEYVMPQIGEEMTIADDVVVMILEELFF